MMKNAPRWSLNWTKNNASSRNFCSRRQQSNKISGLISMRYLMHWKIFCLRFQASQLSSSMICLPLRPKGKTGRAALFISSSVSTCRKMQRKKEAKVIKRRSKSRRLARGTKSPRNRFSGPRRDRNPTPSRVICSRKLLLNCKNQFSPKTSVKVSVTRQSHPT